MSSVPEILAAQAHKMRVVVLSVVTNLAAGVSKEALTYEEVMENAQGVSDQVESVFIQLVKRFNEIPALKPTPAKPIGSHQPNTIYNEEIQISEPEIQAAAESIC
jgi:hypothetical protein